MSQSIPCSPKESCSKKKPKKTIVSLPLAISPTLRKKAQSQGLKISEYGVFQGKEQIAGATEEEVYAAVGEEWVKPEEREKKTITGG